MACTHSHIEARVSKYATHSSISILKRMDFQEFNDKISDDKERMKFFRCLRFSSPFHEFQHFFFSKPRRCCGKNYCHRFSCLVHHLNLIFHFFVTASMEHIFFDVFQKLSMKMLDTTF